MAADLQALPHCALVLFLLLVVPDAPCTAAATSTLQAKCEKYSEGSRNNYEFCMRTMQADRASATADARGLASIAARIARAMAKAKGDKILAAMRGAGNNVPPAQWRCLSACDAEYGAAARRLGLAARAAAAGGGARELRQAREMLTNALGAPATCDAEFANAAQPGSPISAADRRLDDVIRMALAFLPAP